MALMLYWLPIATTEEEDPLNDVSEYSSHGNECILRLLFCISVIVKSFIIFDLFLIF